MAKAAFITGITGQDGAHLARILLNKGYAVHGLRQPVAFADLNNLKDILPDMILHSGDMTDGSSLLRILAQTEPDEIYNLAAQTHVHVSFDCPEYTMAVNGLGPVRLLEMVRALGGEEHMKFFQASTSEMFGDAPAPQNETSPMNPLSPYAAAKKYAYDMVRMYRGAYGLFACNGIMFNHESAFRGEDFVTRKIAKAAAQIKKGRQDCLYLGNLDATRDWSHAEDIMTAAHLMLQQDKPDDYVLASGQSCSVRDYARKTFALAGFQIEWQDKGLLETGIDAQSGRILIRIDEKFFRPLEVENLRGDAAKAKAQLGWQAKRGLDDIVSELYKAAYDAA